MKFINKTYRIFIIFCFLFSISSTFCVDLDTLDYENRDQIFNYGTNCDLITFISDSDIKRILNPSNFEYFQDFCYVNDLSTCDDYNDFIGLYGVLLWDEDTEFCSYHPYEEN